MKTIVIFSKLTVLAGVGCVLTSCDILGLPSYPSGHSVGSSYGGGSCNSITSRTPQMIMNPRVTPSLASHNPYSITTHPKPMPNFAQLAKPTYVGVRTIKNPGWGLGQAAGNVVKGVHPGFLGAHGTGQVLEREFPKMQQHWRNTRHAINDDW